MLAEEKQKLIENHSKIVSDLEDSKSSLEYKLTEEYELKLQQKDEELKTELNNLLSDKNSSLEDVTKKLEEMHKQEITDIRKECDEKVTNIRNELESQLSASEQKHAAYVEQKSEEIRT